MAIRTYRPVTPSLRFKSSIRFDELTPAKELPKRPRKLSQSNPKKGGRNTHGRITVRHKGGGHKRRYRVIDFHRDKTDIPAKVASIEYDPNRSAFIALINYADGEKRFILAPSKLRVGDPIIASNSADIKPGNCLQLEVIPPGTLLHNLETIPGKGGRFVRAAGQYAQLMAKDGEYCQVKLPSGEIRKFHKRCKASIGQLSNTDNENISWGKAGRVRWKGVRPTVRGVVMNPVDHPMGGGEGRASGGHPRSPWGQKAKGLKTRRNKNTNVFIVKRRVKKK